MKRGKGISPASPEQREKVRDRRCLVCGQYPVDPAHVVPRAFTGDDPRAVIALCRLHHRAYDDGNLDLLRELEPYYREELAFAVEKAGLITTLQITTGERWAPVSEMAA